MSQRLKKVHPKDSGASTEQDLAKVTLQRPEIAGAVEAIERAEASAQAAERAQQERQRERRRPRSCCGY